MLTTYLDQTITTDFSQGLTAVSFDTKIGSMIAIADDRSLYLLEFVDRPETEYEVKHLRQRLNLPIVKGESLFLSQVQTELDLYFEGKLKTFTIPLKLQGTYFQKCVWQALLMIPYGETCSYAEIANAIGMPTAFRAVANANRANSLAIIVPCHRVIKSNGDLCGYGGGVARKEWLLDHEKAGN
jgi:AraC family transcriptional regulator of adaptative response/methylated-DNA-[protein]-cysteine methyltransferase